MDLQGFGYELLVWLGLALAAGLPIAALWLSLPAEQRKLLPPQRQRAVPWRGPELCALLFLWVFWWYSIPTALLQTGFFRWLYGADFSAPLSEAARRDGRLGLWVSIFATPLQVGTALLILRRTRDVLPYQLGLTTDRMTQNVAAGYVTWLVVTPLTYAVEFFVLLYYWLTWHARLEIDHPLYRLAREGHMTPVDWGLWFASAVAAAPLAEEFLFRGVLQPWFVQRWWGGNAACLAAAALAVTTWISGQKPWPLLFVLAMLPGYFLAAGLARRWLPRPGVARAIYGTALLFAIIHSFAWPTPIPLFFLGLGLGWLAYRTQSLIGPIVVHALFNGTACLVLALS